MKINQLTLFGKTLFYFSKGNKMFFNPFSNSNLSFISSKRSDNLNIFTLSVGTEKVIASSRQREEKKTKKLAQIPLYHALIMWLCKYN